MKILNSLLSLPIAYLLGSIPSAIWIAKLAKGKDFDIRDYGSKNAGLTNTFRVLGWKPALQETCATDARERKKTGRMTQ